MADPYFPKFKALCKAIDEQIDKHAADCPIRRRASRPKALCDLNERMHVKLKAWQQASSSRKREDEYRDAEAIYNRAWQRHCDETACNCGLGEILI